MDTDDLEPRRAPAPLPLLENLGLAELEALTTRLREDLVRVETEIARKKAHRAGIEALFGKQE